MIKTARETFNINLDSVGAVNRLILIILENGFSETPDVMSAETAKERVSR